MSKLVTKQNNKSFKESFNHVEPYVMSSLHFTEHFDYDNPPTYSFDFLESFDS